MCASGIVKKQSSIVKNSGTFLRDCYDFCKHSKEYSSSKLIDWADIVLHAGTGIIWECFMKEKPFGGKESMGGHDEKSRYARGQGGSRTSGEDDGASSRQN